MLSHQTSWNAIHPDSLYRSGHLPAYCQRCRRNSASKLRREESQNRRPLPKTILHWPCHLMPRGLPSTCARWSLGRRAGRVYPARADGRALPASSLRWRGVHDGFPAVATDAARVLFFCSSDLIEAALRKRTVPWTLERAKTWLSGSDWGRDRGDAGREPDPDAKCRASLLTWALLR